MYKVTHDILKEIQFECKFDAKEVK